MGEKDRKGEGNRGGREREEVGKESEGRAEKNGGKEDDDEREIGKVGAREWIESSRG